MSLHLPPRLCFGLVGIVLLGVLTMGNPCRGCRMPAGAEHPAEPAASGKTSAAPFALQASVPLRSVAAAPADEPCPMPEFARDVVAVRHDAQGETVWVLADGRQIRRAPGGAAAASFQLVRPESLRDRMLPNDR